MIKKHHTITKEVIQHEIETHKNIDHYKAIELATYIYLYILMMKLEFSIYYEIEYERYRNIDYMYNYDFKFIETSLLMAQKKEEVIRGETINKEFYESFGIQID